jgi:phage protein D
MLKKYWFIATGVVFCLMLLFQSVIVEHSVADTSVSERVQTTKETKLLEETKIEELDEINKNSNFDLRGYSGAETLDEHIDTLIVLHPYSRINLVEVLTIDFGFESEAASVAIDARNIDWDEMARLQANIIRIGRPDITYEELIEHLVFVSGFTPEQAQVGTDLSEFGIRE